MRRFAPALYVMGLSRHIGGVRNFSNSDPFSRLKKILEERIPSKQLPEVYDLILSCAREMKTQPPDFCAQLAATNTSFFSTPKSMDMLEYYITNNQFPAALTSLLRMSKSQPDALNNNPMIEELYLRMWTKCLPESSQHDDLETKNIKEALLEKLNTLRTGNTCGGKKTI